MKTTLQRWGNSQGVRLPKTLLEALGIGVGAQVSIELSQDGRRITITPVTDSRPIRGRYRIEDLVAEPTERVLEVQWGTPQGEEAW
jgi:antitoxin MazE